jgi:hypothetical protein
MCDMNAQLLLLDIAAIFVRFCKNSLIVRQHFTAVKFTPQGDRN